MCFPTENGKILATAHLQVLSRSYSSNWRESAFKTEVHYCVHRNAACNLNGLWLMQCSCKCCDDNNCVVVLRDEGFWPMCTGDSWRLEVLKTFSFSYSSSKERKSCLSRIWRHWNTFCNFLDFMLRLVSVMLLFPVRGKQDCAIDDDRGISIILEQIQVLCFPSY